METITRKAARAAGLKHYFTSEPCKRGHIDKRFVCSFCCVTCSSEKAKENYAALNVEQRKSLYAAKREYLKQWLAANRSGVLARYKSRNKAYKEANPEYFQQHYEKNKDRRKQESQAWYHANVEYANQRQREYNEKHPEQVRERGRRGANTRRARKAKVFVEAVDHRKVFERDKGICGICKLVVDPASKWEVDHVIPISRGGAHSYGNVQLAHRKCNRAKWASMPIGQATLFQVAT